MNVALLIRSLVKRFFAIQVENASMSPAAELQTWTLSTYH